MTWSQIVASFIFGTTITVLINRLIALTQTKKDLENEIRNFQGCPRSDCPFKGGRKGSCQKRRENV